MGYRRKPKQYRLVFEDEDMAGFECVAGSVSIGEFAELSAMAAGMTAGVETDMTPVFEALVRAIVSWNLEADDGTPVPVAYAQCVKSGRAGALGKQCSEHAEEPVPCQYTGLCSQDTEFALAVLTAWMGAIASVAPPLLNGSSSGGTSREESLQLASLSRSLPNSSKPS